MDTKAKKDHRCTYCGEPILKGDPYLRWKSVGEDGWFTSKMHSECHQDHCESGDHEYFAYQNERPKNDLS
jgi:hypothetical protein